MTSNTTNRTDSSFRNLLRGAIIGAEGSEQVGFPASGRSGVSVTSIQIDLAGNPHVRRPFIDAAIKSGAIENRAEAERLFSIRYDHERMGPGQPGEAQFLRDQRAATALAEKAMQSPAVRAVTDRAVERHIDKVAEATDRVCGRAAPQAQAFCNSTQGRLEVAAYIHQGNPDDTKKIEAYFRGETVTLGDGKGGQPRNVKIQGTLDAEQFRNGYQGSTLWGQTNRKGLDSRHRRIGGFLRQQGIDDGSRARINPGQRSEAAPTERDAAQGASQASFAPEQMREQSANIAAASGQPLVRRTSWTPDPAKIGEAIASVHADDLPAWTRNLLGRDVLTNGAKPAVMGFQRAINAATKPPRFDYRWGLGGRQGRIEVDGDLGPQTRAGFGRAVEKQDEDGFKKLYALDQFGRYVANVDRGRAKLDDLEDTIGGTLGQAIPDAPERAQETLNMFAEDREEPGSPLKIDGWVGPKTTEAFGTLLRKTSPNALTARFAGNDFWEDEDLA
ncbi:MAG: hypothetical protein NBV67_16280 [Tagaea sp.]|nr:hypothetical protein [Tagaea sp.]